GLCLIALLLSTVALPLRAQEVLPAPGGPAAEPPPRTEILGINQTKKIGMTTKAPIVDLQNENPTVVRIDKVAGDPTTLFVNGMTIGGVQQVQLEVVVAAVNRSRLRQMQFDFFLNNRHSTFNSSFAGASFANSIGIAPAAAAGSLASAPGNLTFGVLDPARGF